MVEKIISFLEEEDIGIPLLKRIWNILYEDWEDFPDKSEETIELIIDNLSDAGTKKIKKIYNLLFKDEDE